MLTDNELKSVLASWDNEDFFDVQSKKLLNQERKELDRGWSEAFAESYNNEIDMFNDTDAINPKHYKNVAAGKQYMELMVDMLEGKSGVEAHLFGQVYKYLMRCGNKDEEVQELGKALWYLQALIKYKSEGKVL
jgi:hypothetical protein